MEFHVPREEFEIVPFPINTPELIFQYAPKDAVYYMSICSSWDEEKYQILQSLGLNVEVLWRRTGEEKGITGTELRTMIARGGDWQQHMPKTAADCSIRRTSPTAVPWLRAAFPLSRSAKAA